MQNGANKQGQFSNPFELGFIFTTFSANTWPRYSLSPEYTMRNLPGEVIAAGSNIFKANLPNETSG